MAMKRAADSGTSAAESLGNASESIAKKPFVLVIPLMLASRQAQRSCPFWELAGRKQMASIIDRRQRKSTSSSISTPASIVSAALWHSATAGGPPIGSIRQQRVGFGKLSPSRTL